METRHLTCINCPMGCQLTVTIDNGEAVSVTGNSCKRGEIYGKSEVTNPTRTVTSTARVSNGEIPVVSVKTSQPIPKEMIADCVARIKELDLSAPVHAGDRLIKNFCPGIDIIATKNVSKKI